MRLKRLGCVVEDPDPEANSWPGWLFPQKRSSRDFVGPTSERVKRSISTAKKHCKPLRAILKKRLCRYEAVGALLNFTSERRGMGEVQGRPNLDSRQDRCANYFGRPVILLSEDVLCRVQSVFAPARSRAYEGVPRTLAGSSLQPARRE